MIYLDELPSISHLHWVNFQVFWLAVGADWHGGVCDCLVGACTHNLSKHMLSDQEIGVVPWYSCCYVVTTGCHRKSEGERQYSLIWYYSENIGKGAKKQIWGELEDSREIWCLQKDPWSFRGGIHINSLAMRKNLHARQIKNVDLTYLCRL